ncbi:MAK10-like protein [Tanacetum coccineum]
MGTMWYLCDPTPSSWCKTDAHSTDFGKGLAYVYFNFPFAIKLAIGLNVFQQDPSPFRRILLPTRFKDLLQKFLHHGIDLWLKVQIFYDHVNPAIRRTIDQSDGGKLRDKNAKESWALLEVLTLYDNESWNDPRDSTKPVRAISLPQDVPSTSDLYDNESWNDPRDSTKPARAISLPQDVPITSDHCLIELENQVQRLMEAHLTPNPPVQVNKIASSYGTKSYPVGIVKNIEVHIGRLKLLEDFYVIDMDKDPATPLLVGRGFLATTSAIIDCTRPPYYAKKDFMDYHLPGDWEMARDAELNPFKDVLVFRKMVEFLEAIPINLKGNMWESKELVDKRID